jgi:hypothetical protein
MLLVGVKAVSLSLDAASQAWSWIRRPVVGQKTASFLALEWLGLLITNLASSKQQWQVFIVAIGRIQY